jgi:hypothetical protein
VTEIGDNDTDIQNCFWFAPEDGTECKAHSSIRESQMEKGSHKEGPARSRWN